MAERDPLALWRMGSQQLDSDYRSSPKNKCAIASNRQWTRNCNLVSHHTYHQRCHGMSSYSCARNMTQAWRQLGRIDQQETTPASSETVAVRRTTNNTIIRIQRTTILAASKSNHIQRIQATSRLRRPRNSKGLPIRKGKNSAGAEHAFTEEKKAITQGFVLQKAK